METITISKAEYDKLKHKVQTLRNSTLYTQLLAFQQSVLAHGEFTRKDLGL